MERLNPYLNIVKNKPYSQQWHEYNLSQTNEKLMFMDLLNELCQYIKVDQHIGKGHPKNNIREMLFCMGLLIYSGKSSRRTISELQISKNLKFIEKVPHFNSILNYFGNPIIKNHLKHLLTLSSLPLKGVEQDFAVDSTGFTTSLFGRWFDHKWGKRIEHRLWRKAHVMSGVKTNIITSIEVSKGTSSDSVMFPDLVTETSQNFSMREVSADKAYSSRQNLQHVTELGAIPFIPFKKNASGKPKGFMIWRRMFQYFQEHYDEFMDRYHKRSNSETVFSMIKRKFGNHLRCKKETAQDNEILMKAFCHNIVVLIHETFELGISTDFESIICAERPNCTSNEAQI